MLLLTSKLYFLVHHFSVLLTCEEKAVKIDPMIRKATPKMIKPKKAESPVNTGLQAGICCCSHLFSEKISSIF